MNNGNMPASPLVDTLTGDPMPSDPALSLLCTGLTKRERFAMAAMQALLSRKLIDGPEDLSGNAMRYADAQLSQLANTQGE